MYVQNDLFRISYIFCLYAKQKIKEYIERIILRQRCDNLGVSLAGCQQQLDRDSWQPDLATEINKLRKLLSEEKRSCYGEGARLNEVHQLFEQVYF